MSIVYRVTTVVIALLTLSASAFSQTWSWGKQVAALPNGGDGANRVTGVSVNTNEDAFIIGDYNDSVLIGGIKVVQPLNTGDECYVAKLNSSGTFAWAKGLGSQYSDNSIDITSDPDGNSYVAVDFEGTLDLDSLHLNAVSISSVAIAKYNSNGGVVWTRLFWNALQGPGGLVYYKNHIYAAINRTLIKYTTDGDTVWVHSMPDNVATPFEYNDVAIDSSGHIVTTGSFTYRAIFGNDTLQAASVTDVDFFVAKFDEDGFPLWASGGGAPSAVTQEDVGRAVTVAATGEIYAVGKFKGTAHFDADSIQSGNAAYEMFIAKYDSDGHLMWVKGGNGPNGSSEAYGVATLPNNDILVAGSYTNRVTIVDTTFLVTIGDVLMLRITSDGDRRWGKRTTSFPAGVKSRCLAMNSSGTNAYVGGQMTSSSIFGPSTLTIVSGSGDGWIAQMGMNVLTEVREIVDAPLPHSFALAQNYPNPFNPATTIEFKIARTEKVNLEVFNILGEHVRNLVDQELPAGNYSATWDGRDGHNQPVSSGIYFYRLHSGDYVETHKMTLLK
jgi:hypothetical protein